MMLILGSEVDGVVPKKNRVRKRRVEVRAKEVKTEFPDEKVCFFFLLFIDTGCGFLLLYYGGSIFVYCCDL